MPRCSPELAKRARALRRDATPAERALWRIVTGPAFAGYRFRRQHPVAPYVLDIACARARLAIEADGGHHAENRDDQQREASLAAQGWRILRFWNNEILDNPEGVALAILAVLGPHPDPPPPAAGEGETFPP